MRHPGFSKVVKGFNIVTTLIYLAIIITLTLSDIRTVQVAKVAIVRRQLIDVGHFVRCPSSSAFCQFLHFSNRTIQSRVIDKNVIQSHTNEI